MISLRTDPEIDVALAILGATAGNRSQIVRAAILDAAAARTQHRDQVKTEVAKARDLLHEALTRLEDQ